MRIPLLARDGTVVGHTLVDPIDAERISQYPPLRLDRKGGYALIYRGDRRHDRLQRFILGLERGDPREGDHRDGNRLDNRRANLRIVPRYGNRQNIRRSRARGVTIHRPGVWRARICVSRKTIHLGLFSAEQEAIEAAAAARRIHMPYAEE